MSKQTQLENCQKFLQIYELRKELIEKMPFNPEEQNIPVPPADFQAKISAPNPFDLLLRKGEIRLLSGTEDLQYVVVMEQRGWNFLIVPFSRYSMPATDGELLLQNPGNAYLSVLQVWNARTICAAQLCKSWLVAEMPGNEMENIRAVRRHFLFGEALPDGLAARTGNEVLSPEDPRNTYLQESVEVFAEIDRQDFRLMEELESLSEMQSQDFHVSFPEQTVMAAAGTEFLSDVYIAENKTVSEIISLLVHKKIPGIPWNKRAKRDIDASQPIWRLSPVPTGIVNVLFWQRSVSKLFGLGVLSPSGKIYLQYFCNGETVPDSNDLILLGGK